MLELHALDANPFEETQHQKFNPDVNHITVIKIPDPFFIKNTDKG